MAVDTQKLKALLREQGFPVSEGENFTANDQALYLDFARRFKGLDAPQALYGLAYPEGFLLDLVATEGDDADAPQSEPEGNELADLPEADEPADDLKFAIRMDGVTDVPPADAEPPVTEGSEQTESTEGQEQSEESVEGADQGTEQQSQE